MGLSNELIGKHLPGATFRWGTDDVILYALGVGAKPPGELGLLDEVRGPSVLPTFALLANWWAVKDVRSLLDTGTSPMVHASQSLDLLRSIPPSGEVRVDAEVAAVWDKGKNSIIELAGTGTDADGPIFHTRSATMLIGVGGWGGERGPSLGSEEESGPPDAVFEDLIRAEQAAIYRLSGDRNPLHIDPAAARRAGFEDVFLHGLCTLGFAARALIATCCSGDPTRLRSISCRFAKPVFLGRALHTQVWNQNGGTISFRTSQDGTTALSAGQARLAD